MTIPRKQQPSAKVSIIVCKCLDGIWVKSAKIRGSDTISWCSQRTDFRHSKPLQHPKCQVMFQNQTFQIPPTSQMPNDLSKSPQFTTDAAKCQMDLPTDSKRRQLRVARSHFGRRGSTARLGSCMPSAPTATSTPWCLRKALGTLGQMFFKISLKTCFN